MRDAPSPSLDPLLLVHVPESLFLSDWYMEAIRQTIPEGPERAELERIREATHERLGRLHDLLQDWRSTEHDSGGRLSALDAEAPFVAQQALLDVLVLAKEGTATFFQKASLVAPAAVADELATLGGEVFDETISLRRMLVSLYETEDPFRTAGEARLEG